MKKRTGNKRQQNRVNIFEQEIDTSNYKVTNHFLERWNERVKEPVFDNAIDLGRHLRHFYDPHKAEHLDGDYYLINGIIFVCTKDESGDLLFITSCGYKENNPTFFDLVANSGVSFLSHFQKKYGKIQLQ